MLKKRFAVVGLSLAIGVTLLASTAFASAQNISGYDAYKSAAAKTFASKNLTMNVTASVTDNGSKLATVDSVIKVSKVGESNFSGETTLNADGKTIKMSNFAKDGQMVTKLDGNDTYFVNKENDKFKNGKFKNSEGKMMDENFAEHQKVGRLVMDSMVGELKNSFITKANPDGSSIISVNLEGNQIPAAVNGVVSLAIKDGGLHGKNVSTDKGELNKILPAAKNMKVNFPELVSDISIKSVSLKAEVSANQIITAQTMKIVVSGKDKAGKVHVIEFNANVGLSNISSTTPDKVDLTGKTVKIIENREMNK